MTTSRSVNSTSMCAVPSVLLRTHIHLSYKVICIVTLLVCGFVFATPSNTVHAQEDGGKTKWYCFSNNEYVATVEISWGHQPKDAEWACKEWRSGVCGDGKCSVHQVKKWYCYRGEFFIEAVDIWWGYQSKDAQWACKEWVRACGDGNCSAKSQLDFRDLKQAILREREISTDCTTPISREDINRVADELNIVDLLTSAPMVSFFKNTLGSALCNPCSPIDSRGRHNPRY